MDEESYFFESFLYSDLPWVKNFTGSFGKAKPTEWKNKENGFTYGIGLSNLFSIYWQPSSSVWLQLVVVPT